VNFRKICVLGLGYIGLPTASTFATNGLEVVGVDIRPEVVSTLQRGDIHIHEPGLRTLVHAAVKSGKLRVQSEPEPADAFIIAVPTPFHPSQRGSLNGQSYRQADMGAVIAAAEAIVPHLRAGNLVVLESTSPPRTTSDLLAPILERSGLKAGDDFHLAYSPERVLPGQILRELIENARVIGGITPACAQAGRDLYGLFVRGEIVRTDATTAETVKLMENTYRDVNIALANEFSRLADRFGVDVWEAISLANRHPRVTILSPGPGVGGHCISVDPWFLVESAPELTTLIRSARQVNDSQPRFVVELIERALGSLASKRIAALGMAYKPDVDDLRESPGIEVIRLLRERGAAVNAFEPFSPDAAPSGIRSARSLDEALAEADAIVLLVGHSQFRDLKPADLASRTPARVVVDAVNAWDGASLAQTGFTVYRLGANRLPVRE
jgi:UDP-N-acetyl-D-mannosaminuronic acid dehydrogenase